MEINLQQIQNVSPRDFNPIIQIYKYTSCTLLRYTVMCSVEYLYLLHYLGDELGVVSLQSQVPGDQ